MKSKAGLPFTSPLGRGIGRLWRPFLETPKRSFGYGAAPGEGLRSIDRPYPLTPTLSPWERGLTEFAVAVTFNSGS